MTKSAKAKIIDNDQWIKDHFEEIVNKYGGKVPYILVAQGRIFPIRAQDDIAKIEARITKLYGSRPVGMPMPKPEDFLSVLIML
jgi:hypothetical protein